MAGGRRAAGGGLPRRRCRRVESPCQPVRTFKLFVYRNRRMSSFSWLLNTYHGIDERPRRPVENLPPTPPFIVANDASQSHDSLLPGARDMGTQSVRLLAQIHACNRNRYRIPSYRRSTRKPRTIMHWMLNQHYNEYVETTSVQCPHSCKDGCLQRLYRLGLATRIRG